MLYHVFTFMHFHKLPYFELIDLKFSLPFLEFLADMAFIKNPTKYDDLFSSDPETEVALDATPFSSSCAKDPTEPAFSLAPKEGFLIHS